MDETSLKEALAHDQAQKATQTPIDLRAVAKQLDDKLAVVAKTTALGLLDVARTFTALALQPTDSRIVTAADGKQRVEEKPPKAEISEKCLVVARSALELARLADILGDRPVGRTAGVAKE
jgi:hypothetical protein